MILFSMMEIRSQSCICLWIVLLQRHCWQNSKEAICDVMNCPIFLSSNMITMIFQRIANPIARKPACKAGIKNSPNCGSTIFHVIAATTISGVSMKRTYPNQPNRQDRNLVDLQHEHVA